MAMNLLQDWCKELAVEVHRALLVSGIPERLQQADIEATLRQNLQTLGGFRLRTVRAVTKEKAQAALVEFGEDIDHSAIPSEIRGDHGVWRVLSKDRGQDARVLRQMRRLLLDERPMDDFREIAIPLVLEAQAQAQGLGKDAKKAGPFEGAPKNGRRGRRGGKHRSRSHRLAQKGKKRGRGGRRARSQSEDSSDDSLGIVIEEIYADDLSVDEDQRALYATLQAAAKELTKKWGDQDEGDGPREFLALVTVTDKAKKEEIEKHLPGTESICLNVKDEKSSVPDLVALLAVRDTPAFEIDSEEDSETESLEDEELEKEGVDNPEFVAIVAYTDPSDPSAREEMLKIASVIETLGWSDKKDKKDILPQVLSVMAKDTSGTRVKVEEAGRQVDAMVLRKAEEDGNLLECISTLAEAENCPKGKKSGLGLLRGWSAEGHQGGLLELVALLAAQDMVDSVREEEASRWGGGGSGGGGGGRKCDHSQGGLSEVLAFLASQENLESNEESEEGSDAESEEESEDTDSEESEPDGSASKKPRAKRARTGSKSLPPAGSAAVPTASRARKTRRGGRGRGRGVTPEKKAGSGVSTEEHAGNKKKKGSTGTGPRARAGEAKGQPAAVPKSTRGKKARRGPRRSPKCR
ncbi:paraneoplastic antigen-like protein 8B [Nannospalax galili]|uniref:PNMA family member 8B n=1 Tax=Nannospalax galili TaxID=1026970 RepID=A0A8C6QPY9_NANGA|nr:paraneoplastic antigen-like protein 8B [Nannospalax galili]XP_017650888.1 paraneoplastic antigen-like protein 8B [Nannospalax galili]XP_017650892.1 paraneoplastic antigen-like protein 8B [Nannospalax galili]